MGIEMFLPIYWHIIHRIVLSMHSFPTGSGRKGIKDSYTMANDVEKYVYYDLP